MYVLYCALHFFLPPSSSAHFLFSFTLCFFSSRVFVHAGNRRCFFLSPYPLWYLLFALCCQQNDCCCLCCNEQTCWTKSSKKFPLCFSFRSVHASCLNCLRIVVVAAFFELLRLGQAFSFFHYVSAYLLHILCAMHCIALYCVTCRLLFSLSLCFFCHVCHSRIFVFKYIQFLSRRRRCRRRMPVPFISFSMVCFSTSFPRFYFFFPTMCMQTLDGHRNILYE